jgi:hypothetical protein
VRLAPSVDLRHNSLCPNEIYARFNKNAEGAGLSAFSVNPWVPRFRGKSLSSPKPTLFEPMRARSRLSSEESSPGRFAKCHSPLLALSPTHQQLCCQLPRTRLRDGH